MIRNAHPGKYTIVSYILLTSCIIFQTSNVALAQVLKPNSWFNLDLDNDGVFGASVDKSYKYLIRDQHFEPVIVAFIDGGIDINHEDLRSAKWININEIPGNNKDDDANGYVDDINGWNYLGSSKGSFQNDNDDLVRSLRSEMLKDKTSEKVTQIREQLGMKIENGRYTLSRVEARQKVVNKIIQQLGSDHITLDKLKTFSYASEEELSILVFIIKSIQEGGYDFNTFKRQLDRRQKSLKNNLDYILNINYDPRKGNHEFSNPIHGNSDVVGPDPYHGTHCAGILAATRDNSIGINGVSSLIKLMCLRAVPEGDMLDTDVAAAIRYATDNGAKIINMSFNKKTTQNRKILDDAVKYAMAKDVLIIHASGNEGLEEESENSFPRRQYEDGGEAMSWIEVGASNSKNDETLLAPFSNYGKTTCDLLAPGVNLWSTFIDNSYEMGSGTSLAAPVVSGVASLIRAMFPTFKAYEVKDIIMQSVTRVNHRLQVNGISRGATDVCLAGGVINAYSAIESAYKYKLKHKK